MDRQRGDRTFDFSEIGALTISECAFQRQLIAGLLITFGFERVYEADDALEALERLRAVDPDIVFTEARLSGISGVDFVRAIRSGGGAPDDSVPVVMLFDLYDEGLITQARDAGVTELVEMPLTPACLFKAIEMVVDKPRLFVRSQSYVGPDRRRFVPLFYEGHERRQGKIPGDERHDQQEKNARDADRGRTQGGERGRE